MQFDEDRVFIRADRSKFNLATLPASDYPSLMDWKPEVDFTIEQATLARLIEATQFSMANQDARYFLNGMKFETEGNLLRSVATDGHLSCSLHNGIKSRAFNPFCDCAT